MNRSLGKTEILSCVAVIIGLFLVPVFVKNYYYLHIFIVVWINIMLSTGLRAICAVGTPSLGHGGFMAVGAYVSALMAMKLGISFWVALPLGGLGAMAFAVMVGYPFVRAKGTYFLMLTLFLAEVIRLWISEWKSLTCGTNGLMNIPPPDTISLLGLSSMAFNTKVPYYYLGLVLALVTILFFYRIDRSRIGLTLAAIQQNDFAARSVGINTAGFKVVVFCVGCFFAGIAGSFYAHYVLVLTPDTFNIFYSIYIFIYVMVGGRKSFWGAIVGAIILTVIPEMFRILREYEPYLFAAALLSVVFFIPEGLIGLPARFGSMFRRVSGEKLENA